MSNSEAHEGRPMAPATEGKADVDASSSPVELRSLSATEVISGAADGFAPRRQAARGGGQEAEKALGTSPTFPNVSCSQCGREFGPGDHGFSHCDQHQTPEFWIPELIRNFYDKAPDLGSGGYRAADDSWDDGADEVARRIVARFTERHGALVRATERLLLVMASDAHPKVWNFAVDQARAELRRFRGAPEATPPHSPAPPPPLRWKKFRE